MIQKFGKYRSLMGVLSIALLLATFLLLPSKTADAANPSTMNFQGKVVNADGTNVNSGTSTYSVVFRIYNTASPTMTSSCTSTATCLWQETQASVSVTNGVFQVELGSSCSLTSSSCNNSTGGPINWSSTSSLYLTMQFNGDTSGSNGGFMSPLIHITSVPFAFNADQLGGITASNFVQLAQGIQTDSSSSNASIAINKTGSTANIITLQKTGVSVFTISNTGNTLFKPYTSSDSSTFFQIQNAAGNSLVNVDSSQSNISLLGLNDGQTSAWTDQATNKLPAARNSATSVVANGYVYVLGGVSSGGSITSTVYYAKLNVDGSTGAWTDQATNKLPTAITYATSVVANGYVYVLGGYDGSNFLDTVYYAKLNADGSTGPWTSQATNKLPAVRRFATSLVANGFVYVLSGEDDTPGTTNTVFYARLNADGSTGAWTNQATNKLPSAREQATSVVANGYVYVFGGDDSGSFDSVWYARLNADGSTGAWTNQATNKLPDVRAQATSVVANGYVYIFGGTDSSVANNTVYYARLNADGSTGAWANQATNKLPANRLRATSVTANGYVYEIGGLATQAGSSTDTVYYASTSRVKIGGSLDLVGIQGQNLADQGNGGSITAGNITAVGALQVQGQGAFTQGVGISGALAVNGGGYIKGAPGSANIFQVQNAGYVNSLAITTVNLISNSNFENGPTNVDNNVDGWSKKIGTETSIKTQASNANFGNNSLELVMSAANNGVTYPILLRPSQQYTLSFYAKMSVVGPDSDLSAGRSDTGISTGDTNCTLSSTSITNTYARYNCNFTTGATIGASGQSYIYIRKTTTARTVYLDGVQLETGATLTAYRNADITLNGTLLVNNLVNSNTISIIAGTTSSSYTITLPTAVSSGANYCLVSSALGVLSWVPCGANSSTQVVTLAPEFPGAVLTGDGSNNTGTMTSDFCGNDGAGAFPDVNTGVCASGDYHNYYSWTANATNDYDVWIKWQAPTDFSSLSSINFNGWRSSTSDAVTMTIYTTTGAVCGSATSLTGTAAQWEVKPYTISGCSPSAGNVLPISIHLSVGVNSEFARIGEITITYNRL